MGRRSLLPLLLAALLPRSASAYQEVHELDVRTYQKVADGIWLIKFYAPWCGHCKKMAPVYEKVAEHYHRAPNPRVHVGKIDGTAHPGLAAPFDLKGYPTVLLLRDGEMISEFNGPRTLDGIKAFVDGAINEPSAAGAPAAPRIGGGGGGRASGATGESLSTRMTRMAKSLSETDPITAALSMLGIAVSAALGLVILLCATTSAPPERGAAGAR